MSWDASAITIIFQLIFLECILSIDNAAVLGAMVIPLPNNKPVPWPSRLKPLFHWLDPLLGPQRQAALKVGLLGAYAGRIIMLFLATIIIQNVWMQIIGGLYLIFLAVKHFGEQAHHHDDIDEEVREAQLLARKAGGFWKVVLTIELADLAFSLDNVVAAVALSKELWIVMAGVAIGILMMRFAAQLFARLIAWEPALDTAAYLLLLAIGGELLLEHFLHIELSEWAKFGVSLATIALVIIFARVPLLRRTTVVFRPIIRFFALVNDALSFILNILALPFRRSTPKTNEF